MSEEQVTGEEKESQLTSTLEEVAQAAADLAEATVQPVAFGPLDVGSKRDEDCANLDLLLDVQIPISAEVGRAELSLQEVLNLVPGSAGSEQPFNEAEHRSSDDVLWFTAIRWLSGGTPVTREPT